MCQQLGKLYKKVKKRSYYKGYNIEFIYISDFMN